MKPTTSRLLASAAGPGTRSLLRPEPLALLPPIPLYRRLLRAHRKHLPRQMRLLGDEYVKAEFRAHRNVENPAHLVSVSVPRYSVSQWVKGFKLTGGKDWLLDRVAAVCAEGRG